METGSSVQAMCQLPAYRSHKTVWALRIAKIAENTLLEGAEITPFEEAYAPFRVSRAYMEKHHPYVGGYWVRYTDGYESFSPAQAFEEGYTRI